MGWYLRKSISFGPLRLNLSKSGLGYSFGVKGARVGTGPRGNYIHMGRHGLYYRQYFSERQQQPQPSVSPISGTNLGPRDSSVIATADVSALHDSTAEDFLDHIREQNQK